MGPPLSSSGQFERTDVMSENDQQDSGPGDEENSVPEAPAANATTAEPAPDNGDENPMDTAVEPAPSRSDDEPTDVPAPPVPALPAAPGAPAAAAGAGEPGQRRITRHTTTSTTSTETTTDETVVETIAIAPPVYAAGSGEHPRPVG
jgi:hypothetical protein